MELLKSKIMQEGRIEGTDILKVDSFLNHQMDIILLNEIGKEFKQRFKSKNITKILTIESSGIAIAAIAAQYFNVPVLFAKKTDSRNIDKETYDSQVYSFTKQKEYTIRVSKRYLTGEDKVLIIDDFLANGQAVLGLLDIIKQAEASVEGVGIVIEKGFQPGGKKLRELNIDLQSLAIVGDFKNNKINFL